MQLCWGEPAQRPSLRELRIMLLHLLSRKDDPDTSAFDHKWNMLLPRHHPSQVTKVMADVMSNGGMTITGTEPGPTPQGQGSNKATRPSRFESNFVELNASMLGNAGSLDSELRDEFSPDLPGVHGHLGGLAGMTTTPANEMSLEAELSQVKLEAAETPANELTLAQELSGVAMSRGEAEGEEWSDRETVAAAAGTQEERTGTQTVVRVQVEPQPGQPREHETKDPAFRETGDGPLAQSTPVKENLPELVEVPIAVDEGNGTPLAGQGGPTVCVTSPDFVTSTPKKVDDSDAYLSTTETSTAYRTALTSHDSADTSSVGRSMSSDSGERSLLGQQKFAAMLQTVAMSMSYDGDDPISCSSSFGSTSLEPLPDDDVFSGTKSSESLTAESAVSGADSGMSDQDGDTPTPTPIPAAEESVIQDSGAPLLKDESTTQDATADPLLNDMSTSEATTMADVVEGKEEYAP